MSFPHSHLPYGGENDTVWYTDSCSDILEVCSLSLPLVHEAIRINLKDTKKPSPQVFVIAEFGAADGGISMSLFYSCVQLLKEICGEEQNIQFIYEDQATNDFKSLFRNLNGFIPGIKSYLNDFSNTFITAVGKSFYTQCVPLETYQVGFSSTSFHWLSKKPCNITHGIHHTQIKNQDEKEIFAKQAAEDWECILLHRAKEMKTGGRFVMANLSMDENGNVTNGYQDDIKTSVFDVFNITLLDMVETGRIMEAEYLNTNIADYHRTMDEYKKPFLDESSEVMKSGLRLLSINLKRFKFPSISDIGQVLKFTKKFMSNIRVWSNHSFFSGLSEHRSEEERREIVDDFYQLVEKKVAANPSDFGKTYIHAYIVLEKI